MNGPVAGPGAANILDLGGAARATLETLNALSDLVTSEEDQTRSTDRFERQTHTPRLGGRSVPKLKVIAAQ